MAMDQIARNPYKDEQELYLMRSSSQLAYKLHEVIQRQFNEARHQFPYLSYAQKIKHAKEEVEALLSRAHRGTIYNFQHETIQRANQLLGILEWVFDTVVASTIHDQQRIQRPAYERQEEERKRQVAEKQARLKVELQEREARASMDKNRAEESLLEERRKVKEAENRRLQIRCDERQCEQKEKNWSIAKRKCAKKCTSPMQ